MKIEKMIKYLEIDVIKDSEKDDSLIIHEIFDKFNKKITYDTTKNILQKKLYFDQDSIIEYLEEGFGLHCQEQIYLLKEILQYFGYPSIIKHGDVYDHDLSQIKPMLATILLLDYGDSFFHLDPTHEVYVKARKGEVTVAGNYTLEDCYDDYYLLKRSENKEVYYSEKILLNVPENYRKRKLNEKYEGTKVVPFGVTAPFCWKMNPERKIFYNINKDLIRINIGRNIYYFDILEWDMAPESSWLSQQQKDRINQCLPSIMDRLDTFKKILKVEKAKQKSF